MKYHDPSCRGCDRCKHFHQPFPHATFCQIVPCKCGANDRMKAFEKEVAGLWRDMGTIDLGPPTTMTELVLRDRLTDPSILVIPEFRGEKSIPLPEGVETKYLFTSGDPDAIKIDAGARRFLIQENGSTIAIDEKVDDPLRGKP